MSESHKRARSPGRTAATAQSANPATAAASAAVTAASSAAVSASAASDRTRKKSRFADAPQPVTQMTAAIAASPSPAAPAAAAAPASAPVADADGFLSRASILAAAPKKPAANDDDDFRMPPPRPREPAVAGSMQFGAVFGGAKRPLVSASALGSAATLKAKPSAAPSPYGVPLAAPKKPIIVAKPMMGFNFLAAGAKKPAVAVTPAQSTALPAAKPNALTPKSAAAPAATPVPMDDVDPLEAYMNGLNSTMTEDERKAVSGEAEKEERASHKVHATAAEEAEERKESEAQNGKNAATSTAAVAVPSSAPSAASASPAVATVASGPASAERFYGDEEQLDESVIEAHNLSAEAGGSQSWLEKQAKMKRKDIKPVDHSKMHYAPFRKDFYIESKEIAAMTDAAVDAYREVEMEGVKIRGKRCPKPIREWHQCGLPDKVFEVIRRENYKAPFPIQQQAIPAIMSGRDCICCAKTGSGTLRTIAHRGVGLASASETGRGRRRMLRARKGVISIRVAASV